MSRRLDPMTELQVFAEALEASHKIVRAGGMVDLGGLEAQVEELCREVVKTEGPVRLQILPMLERVIRSLGVLEEELRLCTAGAEHAEKAEKLMRAQSAYAATHGKAG